MNVDRNSTIGGQSIKVVRALLRDIDNGASITTDYVASFIRQQIWLDHINDLVKQDKLDRPLSRYFKNLDEIDDDMIRARPFLKKKIPDQNKTARTLVGQLLKDGFIEPAEKADGKQFYKSTMKGTALAHVNLISRMNRAKADKLLAGVLKRVGEINARPDLLHWVTEVRVFGSYLANTDDLGDLDLAINIQLKPDELRGGSDLYKASEALARAHGRRCQTFHEYLGFPDKLVMQIVKGRSPYISLHYTSELDRNPEFGGKTVYTFIL